MGEIIADFVQISLFPPPGLCLELRDWPPNTHMSQPGGGGGVLSRAIMTGVCDPEIKKTHTLNLAYFLPFLDPYTLFLYFHSNNT